MPYLTFTEFRDGTTMPSANVNSINTDAPAFFPTRERWHRGRIDGGLRRRYAVPFGLEDGQPPQAEPDPSLVATTIKMWMTAALTLDFYQKQGFNPTSEQDQTIADAAQAAIDALKAAANPNNDPEPELPLAADKPNQSGVTKGGPFVHVYNTPYGFHDFQAKQRDGGGW